MDKEQEIKLLHAAVKLLVEELDTLRKQVLDITDSQEYAIRDVIEAHNELIDILVQEGVIDDLEEPTILIELEDNVTPDKKDMH